MFQRRYAPLGYVTWFVGKRVAKRKLRATAERLGLGIVAGALVAGLGFLAWRVLRPTGRRAAEADAAASDGSTIRLLYEDGMWVIRRDGASRASSRHQRKADAEAAARELARKQQAELIVYSREGEIQRRHSYSESLHSE
jgi:hypothetical protein